MKEFENFDFDSFDNDSYDPEFFNEKSDNYDPDNYTRKQNGGGVRRMQSTTATFDIAIKNPTALDLIVDLFNFNYGMHTIRNAQYSAEAGAQAGGAGFAYNPIDTLEGHANILTGVGCVLFDRLGNLILKGADGAPVLSICGGTLPYRSILTSSAQSPFRIQKIKMTVTKQAQLDQIITHSNRTFLGGVSQNVTNPRSEFKISQFQPNMAEIEKPFHIDAEKGLSLMVLKDSVLTLNFSVSQLTRLGA